MKIFYVNRLWLKFPQGLALINYIIKIFMFEIFSFAWICNSTHDKNNDSSYKQIVFCWISRPLELSVQIFIILKMNTVYILKKKSQDK